ncbi:Rgp1-domain-containing protein [Neoconidiobolus thromboides FSU 785]|nr:Rgp1-domain-containing protein [Neoconidiobolus thromboides FSU 785]
MYRAANGVGHGGSLGGGTFGYNASTFINGNSKNSTMADLKRQGESKLFPVYSTPPSVLFCDITLEPGESVIYDYEIQLPENLPPSYRGKSARFLYYLILGTQQGEITLEPNVVQLPFRLFNTKNEYGESSIYNLLQPELIYSDDAIVKNNQDKIKIKKYQTSVNTNIQEFINNGLKSLNLDEEEEDLDLENELQFNMLDIESQCLKAVHQLTRRTKPINYTISKDDTIIGKLYLKKPYYRIGDSVNTIIQFVPSPVKCYQVSVTLESFETLKEGYSHHPKHRTDQMTRQILTHQQCLLINKDRIAIDLTIPTTCTPNFETTVVELGYRLRIEFMVGERNEQNILSTSIDRFRTLNKIQNGNTNLLEKLTCLVPIQLLPTNPNYAKLYRSSHSFQLERNFLP